MDKMTGVVIDAVNPSTWDTEELSEFLASQGYISEALSQKIYIPYFTQWNLVQCYRKRNYEISRTGKFYTERGNPGPESQTLCVLSFGHLRFKSLCAFK